MVVAWLPGTVAWQPYGPFAEPRRPILSQLPGFARRYEWTSIGQEILLGLRYILTKAEAEP